jgi:hypothetical protein
MPKTQLRLAKLGKSNANQIVSPVPHQRPAASGAKLSLATQNSFSFDFAGQYISRL